MKGEGVSYALLLRPAKWQCKWPTSPNGPLSYMALLGPACSDADVIVVCQLPLYP